jgi:hypothetical protein
VSAALVLSELADGGPFATYHDLEIALRDVFRRHYADLPADYTYRDFLEWAFRSAAIVRTDHGFAVEQEAAAVG